MTLVERPFEYFQIRPISKVGVTPQILIIVLLYVLTTFGCYFQVKSTGKMYGYPIGVAMLFVPIYEEMIFRGILLRIFENLYKPLIAVVFVSFLFAIWHLKNIFWLNQSQLIGQMLFTGFIFSPVACWLTLRTKSIWPAVIVHYINNFPFDGWSDYLKGYL